MAQLTNKVAFKKGIIYEEDGEFFIEEIKRDYSETHSLSEYLKKYIGSEDNPRVVDVTINEVFDVEGQE